jgi:hypothetical protein
MATDWSGVVSQGDLANALDPDQVGELVGRDLRVGGFSVGVRYRAPTPSRLAVP